MTHNFKGFCSKHLSQSRAPTIARYFDGSISLRTFSRGKKFRILWFQLLKCENDAFFFYSPKTVNWIVRNRQKVFNHCQLIYWLFSWLTDIQLLSSWGLKRKVTLSDCNPTHEPTNTQKHNLLGIGNQQLHFHPPHLCWSTMLQGVWAKHPKSRQRKEQFVSRVYGQHVWVRRSGQCALEMPQNYGVMEWGVRVSGKRGRARRMRWDCRDYIRLIKFLYCSQLAAAL